MDRVEKALRYEEKVLELASYYFHGQVHQVKSHLKKRFITEESMARFRIGFDDGGLAQTLKEIASPLDLYLLSLASAKGGDFFYKRIIFPIFSLEEEVRGFAGRDLRKDADIRYLDSKKMRGYLYNLPAIKRNRILFLTEGQYDVISLEQLGFPAIGLMRLDVYEKYIPLLREKEKVYIVLDGGEKEREQARSLRKDIGQNACVIDLPDGEDASSLYEKMRGDREKMLSILRKGRDR